MSNPGTPEGHVQPGPVEAAVVSSKVVEGAAGERLARLYDALRRRRERLTAPRRALLAVLADAEHHLTAEELTDRVQRAHPAVHRATVYRTLDTLTRLGLVEHTHLGHGPAVYHLSDDLHQHLVCEACGAVVEAPASLFRAVEQDVERTYGFVMRSLHFAVMGRCRGCA